MSEYNLRITDIEWENGNIYEMEDYGNIFKVDDFELISTSNGESISDIHYMSVIAKARFKQSINWDNVEVNTPILVRDAPWDKWYKRYFSKYKDGYVYAFADGTTSWSSIRETFWQYAKLADEVEE